MPEGATWYDITPVTVRSPSSRCIRIAHSGVVKPPAGPVTDQAVQHSRFAGRGAPVGGRPEDRVPATVGNHQELREFG
jgi:hypothetical protein